MIIINCPLGCRCKMKVLFVASFLLIAHFEKAMQRNDPVLQRLRDELDQTKTELYQYKVLYRNERTDRRLQEDQCHRLQERIIDVTNEKDQLTQELYQCREDINSYKIPKPLKKWQNLKSPVSKARRKAQHRKCLDQSMMHLHEAQRVCVQMKIGNDEIFLVWSEDDLKNLKDEHPNIVRPLWINNDNESHENENNSEDEDIIPDSERYPDAFMSDGTWNPVHLKRIVLILDMYKISQKAYHELRMTSRSILPPINRILAAKKKMSDTIKPLHHRTVIV